MESRYVEPVDLLPEPALSPPFRGLIEKKTHKKGNLAVQSVSSELVSASKTSFMLVACAQPRVIELPLVKGKEGRAFLPCPLFKRQLFQRWQWRHLPQCPNT
jgi:hypothetical protein